MPRKPIPEGASLAHRAARAFHSRVLSILGEETPDSHVAKIVDESRQNYSDALRVGKVSLDRVARWVSAWNEYTWRTKDVAGQILRLETDGDDVRVTSGGWK